MAFVREGDHGVFFKENSVNDTRNVAIVQPPLEEVQKIPWPLTPALSLRIPSTGGNPPNACLTSPRKRNLGIVFPGSGQARKAKTALPNKTTYAETRGVSEAEKHLRHKGLGTAIRPIRVIESGRDRTPAPLVVRGGCCHPRYPHAAQLWGVV